MRISTNKIFRLTFVVVSLLFLQSGIVYSQRSGQSSSPAAQLSEAEQRRIDIQQRRLANNYESRGRFETALKIYEDIYSRAPEDRQNYEGLRRNLVALNRYDEAITLIEERITAGIPGEQNYRLYCDLGATYYKADKKTQAEIAWNQAIEVAPGSSAPYQELAHTFISLRLVERSVDILRLARRELNNPYLFASQLATLLQSRMDWQGAAEEYLLSMRENSHLMRLTLRSLANFPDTEAANKAVFTALEREFKAIEKSEPWKGYRAQLQELMASQYMKNGEFAEALPWIEKVDATDPNPGERLIDFAAQAHNEGADSVAHQALQIAGGRLLDPSSKAGVDHALAGMAVAQGDYEKADSIYSIYCTGNMPLAIEREARLRRGMLRLYYLDNAEDAVVDFHELLKKSNLPNAAPVRYAYASALVRLDSLSNAQYQLDQIKPELSQQNRFGLNQNLRQRHLSRDENWVNALFLHAQIEWWQGRSTNAKTYLDSLLGQPDGSDRENEALSLSQIFRVAEKDSVKLAALGRADKAEFEGEYDSAIELYTSLSEDVPQDSGKALSASEYPVAAEAHWRLGQLYLQLEPLNAIQVFEKFTDRYPEHPRTEEIWLTLGQLAEWNNQSEQAAEYYENLLLLFPDGLLAAEARLSLDRLRGLELPPLMPDPTMTP
ncbi:tetratricopeptide repeat protein [bacterium]|nr:tetratricopeptide repeat protein [bacterium]